MKILTDIQRNNIRYSRLTQEKKDAVNEMALNEFNKPVRNRLKPVVLLESIDF